MGIRVGAVTKRWEGEGGESIWWDGAAEVAAGGWLRGHLKSLKSWSGIEKAENGVIVS
jgi:hypothetical protein